MITEITGIEADPGLAAGASNVRVWGPPGCGKTTYLGRQIKRAASKFGPDRILVASFTKAAAIEIAGKNLNLPRGAVGTLHSHCYRALDCPVIAETKITEWNKERPQFRLSFTASDVEEMNPEYTAHTFGDKLLADLNILRAKMTPEDQWPRAVRDFARKWKEWKHGNQLFDFTDLIEAGLQQLRIAPGNPDVVIIDEAQDLTRLQLKLVEQWGRHAEYLMLAADDDQTIYSFAGAAPEVLFERGGEEYFRHVLSQSYRVPRAVHALSQAWIAKVQFREPKEYKPRDEDGEVKLFGRANYKEVQAAVDDAECRIANGKTVMFLAPCSYMLEPLKRILRARGLPFHNPYRRKRLDWNPLISAARGAAPVDRVWAFLKPRDECGGARWTGEELRRWTAWLDLNGGLLEGAAEKITSTRPDAEVPLEVLMELMEPDALHTLLRVMSVGTLSEYLSWWLDRLPVKKRKVAGYPALVATRRGVDALANRPQIIVGTGHSVKGGEADVVYVFPDLSASGWRQWHGRARERDALIRLGYVMVTRARESVILCEPAGQAHLPLAGFAAKMARPAVL